ncbi:hypothetical protein SAMN04488556_3434 [Halostagnicola kamekurae]|uniref:Winged helix-turn-helix DNA-binding n=2 Tax=Halostagnicola kamekurae TaxID=619731 RepID=A0A1I6TTY4_9EURY|nr:hypothetical protein SAMN04488556_3434 [Halostagnicola kamekurae]
MMLLQLPTDRLILEELQGGRNLGANIADEIDRHKKTVTKRLNQLEDYDLVRNIGRGVYEITSRGEIALDHIDQYDRESDQLEAIIDAEFESTE